MRAGKAVDGCCSALDDEGAVVRLLASRGRDGHNAFLIMTAPLLPSFRHLPHELHLMKTPMLSWYLELDGTIYT